MPRLMPVKNLLYEADYQYGNLRFMLCMEIKTKNEIRILKEIRKEIRNPKLEFRNKDEKRKSKDEKCNI